MSFGKILGDFQMNRFEAEKLLVEAEGMNPGPWIQHSYHVARLAQKIADKAGMDGEKAYILGLLHDIGRRNGAMQARHALEGYRFLQGMGYEAGARICMTHSFQYREVDAIYDSWDCSDEDRQFVAEYLDMVVYDDYDRLIQICDALTLEKSYCHAEKKMINSVLKFGFKDTTLNKWKAILDLKEYFDGKIAGDVYSLF